MQYCKECGHTLNDDAQFCAECGTPARPKQPPAQQQPKKPLSKKQKITLVSLISAILLLIGGYQIGATMTSADRLIDRFEHALQEQDSRELARLLHSTDSRMEITADKLENVLAFIADSPSRQPYYVDILREQAQAFANGYEPYSETIFTLKQEGKTALIYDSYSIEVTPFYFEIETNMADADIFFDGELIDHSDSDDYLSEYGPVLPGVYDITVSYENEYAVLETTDKLQLIESYDQGRYIHLPLYGDYVSLSTDYNHMVSDLSFLIDGQTIDVDFEEAFGPITTDGSLSASAQLTFPWGDVEATPTPIDSNYVYLPVSTPFSDELEQTFIDQIHRFGEEYATTLETKDSSNLTDVTPELIAWRVDDTLDTLTYWDEYWTGEHIKTIIDLDSFYLDYYDEQFFAYVDASVMFNSATVYDEEDISDAEKYEDTNDWQFEFVYDQTDDRWLLTAYSNLWFFQPDNALEIER